MLVIYMEMLEILELVLVRWIRLINVKLLEFAYRILVITIQSFKKCYFLRAYSICSRRYAWPASSPSTHSRRRPASGDPCPGLGSAGLALGGATWRGALLGEEPGLGSRRRPWSPLVAFVWATFGAEGAVSAGGGRACPSLHGCYGRQVLQYLAGSLGRWWPTSLGNLS